jgi:GNAT superfamily N-acetyltransferase
VLDTERGRGVGKWLVETIVSHPELRGVRRWLLATRDAQELYSRFGFRDLKDSPLGWMERLDPDSI